MSIGHFVSPKISILYRYTSTETDMEQPLVIFSTISSEEAGSTLIRQLLEERLIACGNLIPRIRSLYWWKGQIEDSAEALIIMKTTDQAIDLLQARFIEAHPYDVAEFVVIDPKSVSEPYHEWIVKSVGAKS